MNIKTLNFISMKKILLPMMAMSAICAFAQSEKAQIDCDNVVVLSGSETTVALTAGTVVAQSESVVMSLVNDDSYKPTSCKGNIYTHIIVGTDTLNSAGMTGSNNPSAPTVNAEASEQGTYLTAAAAGCQYNFDVAKDGYIYVGHKPSSNKNYYVFEYTTGNSISTAAPIAYTFAAAMDYADANAFGTGDDNIIEFTVTPSNENGYYTGKSIIPWPERIAMGYEYVETADTTGWIYTGEGEVPADVKKNGFGVIKFPVYEGMSYVVFANGSKMSSMGYVFTTEDVDVTLYVPASTSEDGTVTEEKSLKVYTGTGEGSSETTPVKVINANVELDANAPIYNLLGQKVENVNNAGVYIQNGKKFIVK